MSVSLLHKRNSEPGLVPSIGSLELGEIAINTRDGKLYIKASDGVADRIVSFTGGNSPLSISELDANNQVVSGTTVSEVTSLLFDQESGFSINNLGNGAVKIAMNSTFKFWEVDGQDTLIADGLDHIQIAAGNGITLTTDANNFPYQKLTISTPPKTVQLFQDGFLESTLGTVRWYAPGNITVNQIVGRIGTVSNTNIQITIKRTNDTIETLVLPQGTEKIAKSTNFTMNTDDYLTVDLVMSGNSLGRGMSIEFVYTFN